MSDVKETAERISTERLEELIRWYQATPHPRDIHTVEALRELLASRHADAQEGGEVAIEALVHDWEYTDPATGRWSYARTPERAERLCSQGVKLTPVYTLEAVRKEQGRIAALNPRKETAAPSNPVVSDAMVERVWADSHNWPTPITRSTIRRTLTAALSVNPQSGGQP